MEIEGTEDRGCWDVAVVGAGAAGLVAAIRAAECGARVILLEKNRKPGVKILMSGGTRCNLTNARGLRRLDGISGPVDPEFDPSLCRGLRAIQEAFGGSGWFLTPALRKFDVDQTVRMFESEGVAVKVESNGKIFPVTDRAIDVLAALRRRLDRSGALLVCESPVVGIEPERGARAEPLGFRILSRGRVWRCRCVVLAVGGCSYPGCGTTGEGYGFAQSLGHRVVPPRPALVPLQVGTEWVQGLSGLAVPDVLASICEFGGTCLRQRREAVLFAHFGLTGPAILDLSGVVARSEPSRALGLVLDFVPEMRADELDRWFQSSLRVGRVCVLNRLSSMVPQRLAGCLLDESGIPRDRVGPELSRPERQKLVVALKRLRLPILGTLGFEKAEVTSGGVDLAEVDHRTLQSHRVPGLFFAGEILDLDGPIGGYNFQAAWSTGWLAGETAAAVSRLEIAG